MAAAKPVHRTAKTGPDLSELEANSSTRGKIAPAKPVPTSERELEDGTVRKDN